MSVQTPLGKDVLLLAAMAGEEGISRLFSFELDLFSESQGVRFDQIIGKPVTISLELRNGKKRHWNGIVFRFLQGRTEGRDGGNADLWYYRATVTPYAWLLTRTSNSRIFQDLSVPEIVQTIFGEKGLTDFRLQLQEPYRKRNYCVQYMETDFQFVSRLMEDEGIYYYFEHDDRKHVMVIADTIRTQPALGSFRYELSGGALREDDVITRLEKIQEIRPGKVSLSDYNFETPRTGLEVNRPTQQRLGPGDREIFEYPAGHLTKAEGDGYAKVRMQEEDAQITTIEGVSDCRAMTSGYRFTIKDFHRQDMNNKDHALTHVAHSAHQSWNGGEPFRYENRFTCVPVDVPYRPRRATPKPLVHGTQTAVVVGPSGEEIYTDKYGRIKVKFHWDRLGKGDENSSCWIRVAQLWASSGWGGMHIPRIGQEVVVDFLEGDPDRPIVIGCVYHGTNMPPYPLPGEKTKSTIKSDSSVGSDGFNEIRFEDKKGSEQVFIHGEKDIDIQIKNDRRETIGNDRSLTVRRDKLEKVERDKHVTIERDEIREIARDRHSTIKGKEAAEIQGSQSLTVKGDRIEVCKSNYNHQVTGQYTLKGMNLVIEGGSNLTIKVGGNFININPGGVFISGAMVMINSGGSAGQALSASPVPPLSPLAAIAAANAVPGKSQQGLSGQTKGP
ncbi:MAG TPA: type VI secretion system tip protein TssI/VgrG, partial [Thermodesulfobacteriota bacterium]|nr:type VI secretion system tip protein TssI/VgrG [Thermodesulfobacteriota bacterium]